MRGAAKEARKRQKSLLFKKKKKKTPKDAPFHCKQICAESSQSRDLVPACQTCAMGWGPEKCSFLKQFLFYFKKYRCVYVYILIHRREHVAGSVPLVSAQWSRPACVGASVSRLCVRLSSWPRGWKPVPAVRDPSRERPVVGYVTSA